MVELTESLKCLYTAPVEERPDGDYVIRVPDSEVSHGTVSEGESYRIVLLDHEQSTESPAVSDNGMAGERQSISATPTGPPVEEGDVREVTIETLGDQGDGIAKIERGYVVIVPDAGLGDEVTVEVTTVRENVSFAEIVD